MNQPVENSGRMPGLTGFVRLLMGVAFFLNGLNWWFKLITPYPSASDFVDFLPPPDVVGAMIENGILFNMVKVAEVGVGIALLTNRFVPLALVAALPIALPIWVVDVFFIAHLRGQVMGWGTLLLTLYLLLAYFGHYHALLLPISSASAQNRQEGVTEPNALARSLARFFEPVMPVFGAFCALLGIAMVAWLAVMIANFMLDPQPLSALYPLEPRP